VEDPPLPLRVQPAARLNVSFDARRDEARAERKLRLGFMSAAGFRPDASSRPAKTDEPAGTPPIAKTTTFKASQGVNHPVG